MNKKMLFILLLGISLAFFLPLTNHNYFVGAQSLLQTDQTATPLPDDMGDGDDIGRPLSVTVTPLPDVFEYGQDKEAKFSLRDLDYSEIVLTFPDVETVDLNLPDQWNLDAPSYIELHYDLLDDRLSPDLTSTEENEATNLQDVYSAPYVLVYVDNYLAGGFRPEFGENHTVKIDMPIAQMEQALTFDTENYHEVRIEFFEGAEDYYCEYDGVLTIHDDSSFNFSIHTVPTYLDLGDFPAPIVHSSFIPETLYVILPNNYSEKDLDALATVGSAIGRENASVNIEVITASQATQEKLGDHHIIVIGEPSQNEFLMRLYNQDLFDTTLSANKLYYRNRELPEE